MGQAPRGDRDAPLPGGGTGVGKGLEGVMKVGTVHPVGGLSR